MSADPAIGTGFYRNPVYFRSFPDPFVLRWAGQYYAYATGGADDGRVFPVLVSDDLVNWHYAGGAMSRLDPDHIHYWAPETTYREGLFYLYYSVGNETEMQIRVAASERPDGGFEDLGVRLTNEPFAIDAHVFRDSDGADYLFYATDYLEYSHIGTGTAVDRMLSPTSLAGRPRPVTRAKYDWQVYHPNRPEKGFVRWHTVEGPAVIKRKGKYFQMFSGGNWQNDSYGVSYAVSDSLENTDEWRQVSDGITVFPILRSIEGRILGPGHNSIAVGPNGRELYCVYHEWVNGERVPAIDRLDIAGDRMFLIGPTDTPQPFPYRAQRFESTVTLTGDDALDWEIGPECLFEAYFAGEGNSMVVSLLGDGQPLLTRDLKCNGRGPRHLRIEIIGREVAINIDGVEFERTVLPGAAHAVRLAPAVGSIELRALSLTRGFEQLFLTDELGRRGWSTSGGTVADGDLSLSAGTGESSITRAMGTGDHEICLNIGRPSGEPAELVIEAGPHLALTSSGETWSVGDERSGEAAVIEYLTYEWRQLRIVVRSGAYELSVEGEHLLSGECRPRGQFGIIVSRGQVLIEMIRYTEL